MKKFLEIAKDETFPSNLINSFAPFFFDETIKKALLLQAVSEDLKILIVKEPFFDEIRLANSLKEIVPEMNFFTALNFDEEKLKKSKFVCIFNLEDFSKNQLLLLYDFAMFNKVPILAFSNPKYGKFEPFIPIGEQISLIPTILPIFDLILITKDDPKSEDEKVLKTFLDYIEGKLKVQIKKEDFRKFIASARKLKPSITEEAKELFKSYYSLLRKDGLIFPRQSISWFKLMEASARLRLSEKIEKVDVKEAASVFYVIHLYPLHKNFKRVLGVLYE